MKTHNIDEGESITVCEIGLGIGDFSYVNEIIEWVPLLLNFAVTAAGVVDVTKKIMAIYRRLIGKDKNPLTPYEIVELLESRDSWSMSEIKNAIHSKDEYAVESVLLGAGYKKRDSDGKYYKERTVANDDLYNCYELWAEEKERCWGRYSDYVEEEYSITAHVYEINRGLTSLYLQSKYYNTDDFDNAMREVKEYIERTEGLLSLGKGFQFLNVNLEKIDVYQQDCGRIDNNLWSILHNIYITSGKLDGEFIEE